MQGRQQGLMYLDWSTRQHLVCFLYFQHSQGHFCLQPSALHKKGLGSDRSWPHCPVNECMEAHSATVVCQYHRSRMQIIVSSILTPKLGIRHFGYTSPEFTHPNPIDGSAAASYFLWHSGCPYLAAVSFWVYCTLYTSSGDSRWHEAGPST